ncbi:hypothetical protein [Bartonella sp. LJL80]
MKKILAVAMISLMSVSTVMAAEGRRNSSGDGSMEDSYVPGQTKNSPVDTTETGTGKHFGDGAREDKYVPGQEKKSPESKTTIQDSEKGSFGDGSPAE